MALKRRRKPQFYRMACRNCGMQAGMSSAEGGDLTTEMLLRMAKGIKHAAACPDPSAPPFVDKKPPWQLRIVVTAGKDDGSFDLPPRSVHLREEEKFIVESDEGLRLGVLGEHEGIYLQWYRQNGVRFWDTKKTS
jgi:hypothetical protein